MRAEPAAVGYQAVEDPLGQSEERAYQSRISTQDRYRISEYIMDGWAAHVSDVWVGSQMRQRKLWTPYPDA